MTIEVHTWAKQTNTQSGPKSYFVSTNNGESLLLWKTNLEERIANATKSFKVEMEQAGKEILSHDQFQSSLKLFFESSIEQIDTERPSNYKRKARYCSLNILLITLDIVYIPFQHRRKKKSIGSMPIANMQ